MSYQVLARKWRPQRFAEVVGQRAVTDTLQNAIRTGRLAQAFVFAGPRGVGKTTTARILSRALNCEQGLTAEPCGRCDACREIADGRDMDVLEIDAATHTQVDNVRSVIVEGLSIPPMRDRYKIFIIDEVHQLSSHSFNALLKSIEEPPPRVAFIMATTELRKVPDTILSRAQVFEFRTITARAITDELRRIAGAEGVTVSDQALALIARAADGSMRDAETAFDQIIAFAGTTIDVDAVRTVLGLVGRDLLFEVIEAVADERASAAFDLPARAAEAGYDFRLICRELARLVRDLMVVSVDPSRLEDPEIAAEGERDRIRALAGRYSREDLLRAFDVLGRAEAEIRGGGEARYHLEMALLRWMHLRKLVPLEEVIEGLRGGPPTAPAGKASTTGHGAAGRAGTAGEPARPATAAPAAAGATAPPAAAVRFSQLRDSIARHQAEREAAAPARTTGGPPARAPGRAEGARAGGAGLTKEGFLAEVRTKPVFDRTVLAQAARVDVAPGGIVFAFSAGQGWLKDQVEQNRAWLEAVAERLAGHRVPVSTVLAGAAGAGPDPAGGSSETRLQADRKAAVLADPTVQALREVFPVDIREIEERQDP